MATVFDVFKQVQMDYLTVEQSTVYGDTITAEKPIMGIFKTRNGQTQNYEMELKSSSATVHAHPEDFADINAIVGNGIRYQGQTYEIVGVTGGMNFDNGQMEHLTLTLEVADYASSSES